MDPKGSRDYFPLAPGQRAGIVFVPALAPSLLLSLPELAIERPDLHEVNVAVRFLGPRGRAVVTRFRIVGNEIAGFEPKLLKEKRMAAGQNSGRVILKILQRHMLFLAAIDRVVQFNRRNAVVVLCSDLGEHLLNARYLDVAAGLFDGDCGRVIFKDIDVVLAGPVVILSIGAGYVDMVRTVLL